MVPFRRFVTAVGASNVGSLHRKDRQGLFDCLNGWNDSRDDGAHKGIRDARFARDHRLD